MTKQEFLELAARLYDELCEPKLFRQEEKAEPAAEVIPEKRLITNYKPRAMRSEQPVRLDNLASHYQTKLPKMMEVCRECNVDVSLTDSHRYIKRVDIPFLTAFIERKYNNFNEA